jgi:HAD superfamily hydrolase (TIGR01509 family)
MSLPPTASPDPGPTDTRPLKPFRAVIFDMDGVIVDSEPRHVQAFQDVFEKMGMAENHGMRFEDYLGRSDRAFWLDFVARHKPPQGLDELTAWKQNRLVEILRRDQPIFDGLPELVQRLAVRYPLAVASGSLHPVIDEVLAMRQLRRFFSVVVSVGDVGKGKPAPDVFLRAAELLGVEAPACVVIEDTIAGVEAARAAGMQVIAITNTLPAERLRRATRVVNTYEEIERLLSV